MRSYYKASVSPCGTFLVVFLDSRRYYECEEHDLPRLLPIRVRWDRFREIGDEPVSTVSLLRFSGERGLLECPDVDLKQILDGAYPNPFEFVWLEILPR